MSRRFVASLRDTLFKRSWAVSVVSVTFLHALWLSLGVGVSASLQDIAVREGDNITLNCPLNRSNINWTTPTSNVPRFGRNLSILSINRNESGVYKCGNITLGGEGYNVTVQYGAEGRILENETEVNCSGNLTITCEVVAVPWVTEVAWFSGGNKPECIRKDKGVVLSIPNVNFSHSGTYICCPKNRIGNAQNGTTNVTVKDCRTLDGLSITGTKTDGVHALLIALGVVLGFLVVVMVGVYLCLRRRRLQCCCKAYFNGFFSVQGDPNPSPRRRPSLISVSKIKRGEIPVDEFAQHVKFLHTDGDYRFNQEFEGVKNVHVKCRTWSHSDKVENQAKNRYGNIAAYDHSRVILSLTESEPDSHYINANFVDSFEKGNAYIATQGPLPNTVNDFWRMVWEQNCTVVVMITNIIEKGRHKCVMYWPSKQVKSEVHGPLRITYLDEEAFAFYTVRRFEVKPVDQSSHYSQFKYTPEVISHGNNWDMTEDEVKPMTVSQYHFTGWPDHGAPDTGCEYPALSFILKSAAASQDGAGPIIVHCSAGVGRSGAYIVIHSMVKRMHVTGDVNIFDFLSHIRQQRNYLVQEECQYVFVHDALLHYINSGFKVAVPSDGLKDHVQKLRKNMSTQSRLDVEFEDLHAIQVKHYNLKHGRRGCNIAKNRSVDYIPADSARVELFPRPREEGSDYINASYLPGFWKSQAYIATQYPLEDTIDDFWRMVWQENCRSLVMLVSTTELEQDYFHSYLPPDYETSRFGDYEVTVDSMQTRGDIVVRDLRMASVKDPSEYRNIRHFHFVHWPEEGNPWSGQTILQLICKVDSWEKEVRVCAKPFEIIGAILVHCNYGVGRTGVYCILHTMFHQIARDNTVSIYQMARLYNHKRPQCISNKAHYEFCFDTLVEYIEADCSLHLV